MTGAAPSIDSETTSPTTPVPEMVGVAVVVSVEPLAGLAINGGAGGGGGGVVPKTLIGAAVAALLGPVKPSESAIVAKRL